MFSGSISAMLYVSDLEESVDFYHQKLGFGFRGYWDDKNHRVTENFADANEPAYASIDVGESAIGLHVDPDFKPGRHRFELHVPVDDVDALYEALIARGVDATEPKDEPWGDRMFSVTDPDGHVWDFLEPLQR